jgi:hypothetical protein
VDPGWQQEVDDITAPSALTPGIHTIKARVRRKESGPWVWSNECTVIAVKVEIVYPLDTNGNGIIDDADNEFSYNNADPAVLQFTCFGWCSAGADPDKLHWAIDSIGDVQAEWNPYWVFPSIGRGINPTVTFTGMPDNNSDFGVKTISVMYSGNYGIECQDTEQIEVFFDPLARNNDGSPCENPPAGIGMGDLVP